MPDRDLAGSELYVGYLPVPPRLRRFLRVVVPVVLWLMCGASVLFAWSQRAPGTAVWETTPMTLSGTLTLRPYPVLVGDDGQAVLLVELGKHGSQRRLAQLDGRRVRASGWPLHRDGRRLLELEAADSAVADQGGVAAKPEPPRPSGRVTLRGEVVDSKCYLGAMKPGEGRTHKECATLCVAGGIPPMLVYQMPDGRRGYALVAGEDGRAAGPFLLPLIGDPVEIEGELEVWPGPGEQLGVIRARSVRRL